MLKRIIFIILLTNMANSNIDKALPNESNSQINWDFIEELEGNLNYGHQPSQNSGVTIGSGFDLKGKTESDLKDMGFTVNGADTTQDTYFNFSYPIVSDADDYFEVFGRHSHGSNCDTVDDNRFHINGFKILGAGS